MDFNRYQDQAIRTANMNLPENVTLAVFALGIVGESQEFADADTDDAEIKEGGDVLWYVACAADLLKIRFEDLNRRAGASYRGHSGVGEIGAFCDSAKKFLGHGHPPDYERLRTLLADIWAAFRDECTNRGLDLQVMADRNILKLKARYPEGFSSERSINRETEA